MSEYLTKTLSQGLQYRTLSWLRGYTIPDTSNMKLSKDTPENREIIKSLNYVEYTTSPNIVRLAELNHMDPHKVLAELGYFNRKDAEGLVAWNKFSFDKPFIQSSLSDTIDFQYPKTGLQSEAVSKAIKLLNIPKYALVTLDPLQHMFLFSSSILANAGPRLPLVMGRFAKTAFKALINMPVAAYSGLVKGETQTNFPKFLGGGQIEKGFSGKENIVKFLPHGLGAAMSHGWTDRFFQDEKVARYLIPEMMTGAQARRDTVTSTLNATKIMFSNWLQEELYYVTNARYNQFRTMVGHDGSLLMTDEEAARRATQLVMNGAGTVHPSSFGPTGPAWHILTFARGLTIAPLRVISGIAEPTLRKIYGPSAGGRLQVDKFSGLINPITMRDISAKDADFLQFYYAQHLAKVIGLRVLAMGVAQYAMSFLDDDKKDEFGQQGHDPMNQKRFIFNNPLGMRLGVRTPWSDVNGRRIMLNPTPFREGSQLVDMTGIGSRYNFPESTVNWMKNRLNAWVGLFYAAGSNVDFGTGQTIPGKGTDEWLNEMTKYMLTKVTPLSLGFTQEEKEQRIDNPALQAANQLGAFFGTTPTVAPKGWYPGYEESKRIENEYLMKRQAEREDTQTMTKQQVLNKQLTAFFTAKERKDIAEGKDPYRSAREVMKKMQAGAKLIHQQEVEKHDQKEEGQLAGQAMQTVGSTGE